MTRQQRKEKRTKARKRNQLTVTRWERRVRDRKPALFAFGLVGVLVMGWLARRVGLEFPEKHAVLALGWLLGALVSVLLPGHFSVHVVGSAGIAESARSAEKQREWTGTGSAPTFAQAIDSLGGQGFRVVGSEAADVWREEQCEPDICPCCHRPL